MKPRTGIVGRVVDAVAIEWELDPERIYAGDRHKHVSAARSVCLVLLRKLTKAGYIPLAAALDMDQSSVRASVLKLESELAIDRELAARVEVLRRRLLTECATTVGDLTEEIADIGRQIRFLVNKRRTLNEQLEALLEPEAAA